MKSEMKTLSLKTNSKEEMLNLTAAVGEAVSESGVRSGLVGIYSRHTTAALFVSEFQTALIDDVVQFLRRVVEDQLPYKHNSPEFSDCARGR